MKESHRKGVANRPDPESCAAYRKVRREALTGAHAGRVLSPEKGDLERRRCQAKRKATRTESQARDAGSAPRGRRPHACMETRCTGTSLTGPLYGGLSEVPVSPAVLKKAVGRKESPRGHVLHARRREVGMLRSTCEGSEQTSQGGRRSWREGGGSRRTRWIDRRIGLRTGRLCQQAFNACVRRPQEVLRHHPR